MDPAVLFILPGSVTLFFFFRLMLYWRAVDRFVSALHRDHHDLWIALGKPCGWQWSAPGKIGIPSSMFSFRWNWLRQDPDWLSRTPELRDAFSGLRQGFREWNLRAMPITIVMWGFFFLLVYYLQPA